MTKKQHDAEIKKLSIQDLVPYKNNARTHTEEHISQIAESIKEFGFTNPILIDSNNGIIAGHGRVLAAHRIGLKYVPTVCLDYLTETQKRAYIIADNKLALNAGWDDELLKLELAELDQLGFDNALIGFSADELDGLLGADSGRKQDKVPDTPDPSDIISQPGDIWLLGNHRIICGDSTDVDVISELMIGKTAACMWTDPPYNVNYEGTAGKIRNDNMQDDQFRNFLKSVFDCAFKNLAPGSPVYIAHADTEGLNFRWAFKKSGFKISGCLIWEKNSLVLGRSDYQWRHEPILYGWKPGAAHRWYGGRKQTTVFSLGDDVVSDNGDGTITLRFGETTSVISGTDIEIIEVETSIFRVEKPQKSKDHPTMKPVELIKPMLKNSTKEGDIVLDLFGGSGSTLIACEMLGRICMLCELCPAFCDVIVRRWQDFTGNVAVNQRGVGFDTIGVERGA